MLISAIEGDGIILGHDEVGNSSLRLVVDLGMPRTVSSSVTQGTIALLDVEDLGREVNVAMEGRHAETDAATQIVLEEVTRYLEDQRGRGAAPTIVTLREQFEEIRIAELHRREADMASFSADQRETVDAVTRSLLAKLLHGPTVALKDSAGTLRGERLIDAVRSLFEQ